MNQVGGKIREWILWHSKDCERARVSNLETYRDCPMSQVRKTSSALVPAVDHGNFKNVWATQNDFLARNPGQENAIRIDLYKHACSPGADVGAVLSRLSMLGMLQKVAEAGHFRFPWIHYGKAEEVVFKIVATTPMVKLKSGVKQEGFPFDVEELIRQIKNESEE